MKEQVEVTTPIPENKRCEIIVHDWENKPKITNGVNRAAYLPGRDTVQMPKRDSFKSTSGYYATLYHELIHATGHESRLAREGVVNANSFGDHEYSSEELVAELGSAFLCAESQIDSVGLLKNSASYIANWLEKLENDKKLVIFAASKAQKASNMILNRLPKKE